MVAKFSICLQRPLGIYKPLYDISVFKDIPFKKNINNDEFKLMLLNSQGHRCYKCKNFILDSDIYGLNIHYKQPIYSSGSNTHENLMILCPTCQKYLT